MLPRNPAAAGSLAVSHTRRARLAVVVNKNFADQGGKQQSDKGRKSAKAG
jgi:hypothetical protein